MSIAGLGEYAARLVRQEAEERAKHAVNRGLIRRHLSHGEQAELFTYCLPLALADVARDTPFAQFVGSWTDAFGADIQPHLLSLYLAALTSCGMDGCFRRDDIRAALDYDFEDDASI